MCAPFLFCFVTKLRLRRIKIQKYKIYMEDIAVGVIVKIGNDNSNKLKSFITDPLFEDQSGMFDLMLENPDLPETNMTEKAFDTAVRYVDSMLDVIGAIVGKQFKDVEELEEADCAKFLNSVKAISLDSDKSLFEGKTINSENYIIAMGSACLTLRDELRGEQKNFYLNDEKHHYNGYFPLRITNAMTGEDMMFDTRELFTPPEKPKKPSALKRMFGRFHKEAEKRDYENRQKKIDRMSDRLEKGIFAHTDEVTSKIDIHGNKALTVDEKAALSANATVHLVEQVNKRTAGIDVKKYEVFSFDEFMTRTETYKAMEETDTLEQEVHDRVANQTSFDSELLDFVTLEMEEGILTDSKVTKSSGTKQKTKTKESSGPKIGRK